MGLYFSCSFIHEIKLEAIESPTEIDTHVNECDQKRQKYYNKINAHI